MAKTTLCGVTFCQTTYTGVLRRRTGFFIQDNLSMREVDIVSTLTAISVVTFKCYLLCQTVYDNVSVILLVCAYAL